MNLAENPLIRSQLREQLRGFGKPALLAALAASAGVFLLYGAAFNERLDWNSVEAARRSAALEFLPWMAILQGAVFVLGGSALVGWTIASHRRSGLLEANRLTALSSRDLLLGYWFGPLLLPLAAAALFGAAGTGLIVLGGLSDEAPAWLQWQLGLGSTGLLASLLVTLVGLSTKGRGSLVLVGLVTFAALAISADAFEVAAAHMLAGTALADELLRLLDGYGTADLTHAVFGVQVPLVATTLASQTALLAGAWFAGVRAVEASRGTRDAARHNPTLWLGVLVGFSLLQFGLLHELFTVPFRLQTDHYWDPNAWSASQGLMALWLTITVAGAAYGMSRVADPVARYRDALRVRLGAAKARQSSPYFTLALFAVAIGALHIGFSSLRDPLVVSRVDFDPLQGALAAGALLMSWSIVTLAFELTVEKFGKRAPAWLGLFIALAFGAAMLVAMLVQEEEVFLALPGVLPLYLIDQGTSDGDVIAAVGAVQGAALGVLVALRLRGRRRSGV